MLFKKNTYIVRWLLYWHVGYNATAKINLHTCMISICRRFCTVDTDLKQTRTVTVIRLYNKLGFSSFIKNYSRSRSYLILNFLSETKRMNGLKFKTRETATITSQREFQRYKMDRTYSVIFSRMHFVTVTNAFCYRAFCLRI